MVVKFQIVSDLHLETHKLMPSALNYITPSADVLILAGDIGRIHKYEQLQTFLKEICSYYQAVLYVLGNHEYYKVPGVSPRSMEELLSDLDKIKSEIPNLHILNRSSVIIGDTCIVGCTLWSQTSMCVPTYIVRIKDISTTKYNYMFQKDLNFIKSMIYYAKERRLKLLVVTHHCPSFSLLNKNNRYSSLYASNLDYLFGKENIHTWVYGHTHYNVDTKKFGTRLVTNQRGKPKDHVTTFSKQKVIEI